VLAFTLGKHAQQCRRHGALCREFFCPSNNSAAESTKEIVVRHYDVTVDITFCEALQS